MERLKRAGKRPSLDRLCVLLSDSSEYYSDDEIVRDENENASLDSFTDPLSPSHKPFRSSFNLYSSSSDSDDNDDDDEDESKHEETNEDDDDGETTSDSDQQNYEVEKNEFLNHQRSSEEVQNNALPFPLSLDHTDNHVHYSNPLDHFDLPQDNITIHNDMNNIDVIQDYYGAHHDDSFTNSFHLGNGIDFANGTLNNNQINNNNGINNIANNHMRNYGGSNGINNNVNNHVNNVNIGLLGDKMNEHSNFENDFGLFTDTHPNSFHFDAFNFDFPINDTNPNPPNPNPLKNRQFPNNGHVDEGDLPPKKKVKLED